MECAQRPRRAGFDACFVTDHPAPDAKWLAGGGHHALDPFVALSFAAAATTRLRVQTHILVLPYRNPLLTAKSVLSLDVLSGGRVILGVAPGYLKPEFAALGVNFDERNELTDEAIDVMRRVWTEDEIETVGRHFRTRGTDDAAPVRCSSRTRRSGSAATAPPRSGARPNAGRAGCRSRTRRASARACAPPRSRTSTSSRAACTSCASTPTTIGRTEPIDICFSPFADGAQATIDELHVLEQLGVTWAVLHIPRVTTRSAWIDAVRAPRRRSVIVAYRSDPARSS